MQVILLKELRGRGGEGDVIEVARGFYNNYLSRQGYAIKATPGNLKQLEQRRKNIEKREAVRVADATALLERMDGMEVVIGAKVGDEGQLFGSVTGPMIADAIIAELEVEFDKRRVHLGKPIKVTGIFPVEVNVYRTMNATVNVVVVGENDEGIVIDPRNEEGAEVEKAEAAAEAAGDAVADAIETEVVEAAEEAIAEEIAEEVEEAAEAIEDAEAATE